ncbi:hypothetical protein [Streptomyces goshikiensis]|uniref:hypothetical protein n=1 Tax=Streptomyces goshikiensis TaxID=1942 RepID=UPI00380C672B
MGPAKERIGLTIDAILDKYTAGRFPTMRVIWEKLLNEHGVTAAYATVRRYLPAIPTGARTPWRGSPASLQETSLRPPNYPSTAT